MFLRSLAVQGSWNYRTLLGGGFAFALLPVLRAIHRDQAGELGRAIERHRQIFNAHPYLVGVALGAVARLESEGAAPDAIERFKSAVRGSLGSLGDSLVWAGWRPVWAIITLVLLFCGVPWWLAASSFLVGYNAGHLALRGWGFHIGYYHGRGVADQLKRARIAGVQGSLARIGAFLLGLLLPLVVAGPASAPPHWVELTAATAALALGLRLGPAARTPAAVAVAGSLLVALIAGALP
jgi:mannose/fructose/N-acetylgalactosamine-specific phosphotransferase system component IID